MRYFARAVPVMHDIADGIGVLVVIASVGLAVAVVFYPLAH